MQPALSCSVLLTIFTPDNPLFYKRELYKRSSFTSNTMRIEDIRVGEGFGTSNYRTYKVIIMGDRMTLAALIGTQLHLFAPLDTTNLSLRRYTMTWSINMCRLKSWNPVQGSNPFGRRTAGLTWAKKSGRLVSVKHSQTGVFAHKFALNKATEVYQSEQFASNLCLKVDQHRIFQATQDGYLAYCLLFIDKNRHIQ